MSAVIDEAIEDFTTVRAVLNYTRNTGVRPVNYTFEPPPGVPRNSGEIDARTVTINDANRFWTRWRNAAWRSPSTSLVAPAIDDGPTLRPLT